MKVVTVPETIDESLGVVLAAARRSRGLNQYACGEQLGWSQTRMSRLEQGGLPWTVADLFTVAAYLETTAAELLRRAERARTDALRAAAGVVRTG